MRSQVSGGMIGRMPRVCSAAQLCVRMFVQAFACSCNRVALPFMGHPASPFRGEGEGAGYGGRKEREKEKSEGEEGL